MQRREWRTRIWVSLPYLLRSERLPGSKERPLSKRDMICEYVWVRKAFQVDDKIKRETVRFEIENFKGRRQKDIRTANFSDVHPCGLLTKCP